MNPYIITELWFCAYTLTFIFLLSTTANEIKTEHILITLSYLLFWIDGAYAFWLNKKQL